MASEEHAAEGSLPSASKQKKLSQHLARETMSKLTRQCGVLQSSPYLLTGHVTEHEVDITQKTIFI